MGIVRRSGSIVFLNQSNRRFVSKNTASMAANRPVFFFDIDNCLYPKSKKVHDHMSRLIDEYFMKHLDLTQEDAYKLHQEYYKNYGLAIEGLTRHHKIDPLEYNRQVDDAIPLEDILSPDQCLARIIETQKSTSLNPHLSSET